ncbi:outer membrane protein assembly factor BamE [Crenobacter cavernae]|uniref:Outer membrane protein assembly factor BamE n=1 Tax=Crenobacter cavernae TaxID=2290923 RepID=A0A345Y968_9NEIS|nr:outer membrane protein assembly factor BamE [Crenobacter cavernae]AXK40470.1 outer membrane protein assembly factor BamE [Crenobacter cavernae]
MRSLILALSVVLTGCSALNPAEWISPYQLDIPQGNTVSEESLARIKPGMTRSQVRFVLGTPLLNDPFHADRWDYAFRLVRDGKLAENTRLTLHFNGDTLARTETYGLAKPQAASEPAAVVTPATQ